MEAVIKSTMPGISADPLHEVFLSQAAFCQKVGISVPLAQKLRRAGVLPFIGGNPVYIPLIAGSDAIARYCKQRLVVIM